MMERKEEVFLYLTEVRSTVLRDSKILSSTPCIERQWIHGVLVFSKIRVFFMMI